MTLHLLTFVPEGRRNTHHSDIQHNDIQHNDIQHNDPQYSGQHSGSSAIMLNDL
jgi:hypothetical protein